VPSSGEPLFATVDGGGDCKQSTPCTLMDAIDMAVGYDEIYLAAGVYSGATIEINQQLSLHGGWDGATGTVNTDHKRFVTILDGDKERRVMNITGTDATNLLSVSLSGMTIRGGRIDESNPAESGAGINALYADLRLYDMIIEENHLDIFSVPSFFEFSWAGGLAIDAGSLTIDNSIFRGNSSWAKKHSYGGALSAKDMLGMVSINNSLFHENDAWNTSGAYITFSASVTLPVARVEGSKFISNGRGLSDGRAYGGYVGALSVGRAYQVIIKQNTFLDNHQGNDDGAISISYSSLKMGGNLIAANSSYRTSAVQLRNVDPFYMVNNFIVRNQSSGSLKGAVAFLNSNGSFIHNTLVNNTGEYVAELVHSTVSFANNIVGNANVAGIFIDVDSTLGLTNTLWGAPGSGYENTSNLDNNGTLVVDSNNTSGDPGFVDADNWDYRLSINSDALDAGISTDVSDDFHGQMRPAGAAADIGADERMVSSCSGATAEENAPTTYTGEYFCSVTDWIKAGDIDGGVQLDSVIVSTNADVTYSADEIMIFPGFRVENRGKFRAGAGANP